MKLVNNTLKSVLNLFGFKTKRKLILFVVDDYGSIRMPDKNVYKKLSSKGINFENCRFSKFETIESNTDLEALFNVLTTYKDMNGNHVVFSPITCVANPDFIKIKENGFEKYYYESFIETLKKYNNHDKVYDYWKKGIEFNIFVPQSHNREHLNVRRWMKDLQNNNPIAHFAFNENMFSVGKTYSDEIKWEYQPALEIEDVDNVLEQEIIINEGLDLFKKIFGYSAVHFTPPNATINHNLYNCLYKNGIRLMDSPRIENETLGKSKIKKHIHHIGQQHKSGLSYIVRNAVFEPNDNENFDSIGRCLSDIEMAFKFNQPAIISSHRVNYCGELYPENRDKGLQALSELIKKILFKWPDVEFISVNELNNIMAK
jgi:hypothetical protein